MPPAAPAPLPTAPQAAPAIATATEPPAPARRAPGRPRCWDTPEQLDEEARAALQTMADRGEIPVIATLAEALGVSRETLYAYERQPAFTDTIKMIRCSIESGVWRAAAAGKLHPAVGIFALKQYGWTDRESSGGASGVTVTVQVAAFGGQGSQVQVLTEATGPAETAVEDGD